MEIRPMLMMLPMTTRMIFLSKISYMMLTMTRMIVFIQLVSLTTAFIYTRINVYTSLLFGCKRNCGVIQSNNGSF